MSDPDLCSSTGFLFLFPPSHPVLFLLLLQHLFVRLPVRPQPPGHRRPASAAGVQKGVLSNFNSTFFFLFLFSIHFSVCLLQRRRPAPKVEMGTSSHSDVDLSWIPQETLNQISKYLSRLTHNLELLYYTGGKTVYEQLHSLNLTN